MQATILITDDEVDNLNLLRNYLEASTDEFTILRATDGRKALEIAQKALPDVILMDWEMPVMDGLSTLKALKGQTRTADIPVIMVTVRTKAEDLEAAFEMGAMDYIPKPIHSLELRARVRSAIRLRRAYQKLEGTKDQLADSLHEIQQKNRALERAYNNIQQSINYASRIQQASLQEAQEIIAEVGESFLFYQPKSIVSGDFYWATRVPHATSSETNQYIIAVIDCTGHGVPGALMTMIARTLLDNIVIENCIYEPHRILESLDKNLCATFGSRQNSDGMELALFSIDSKTRQIIYAGAKTSLYIAKNQEIEEIKASRYPIGSRHAYANKIFASHTVQLEAADTLYIFTDGFQDQFGGEPSRKYLRKNLLNFLSKHSYQNLAAQKEVLQAELKNWQGQEEQTDDILVFGLRV